MTPKKNPKGNVSPNGTKSSNRNGSNASDNNGAHAHENIIEELRAQHTEIKELARKLDDFSGDEDHLKELRNLARLWVRHNRFDEDLLFPLLREAGVAEEALSELAIERDLATALLGDLRHRSPKDAMFAAAVNVFLRMVPRLIDLEEDQRNGLFTKAEQAGVDLTALGKTLQSQRSEVKYRAEADSDIPPPSHLRGVGATRRPKEIEQMRGYERERDERGRFVEENDRRGYRGSEARGPYRRDRDDDYDRRDYRRDRDDDDRRGWYGDSRGHSEAARRGWEERRGEASRDYDNDRRGGSRGRSDYNYDDDRRGHGGWFGDSEGHSEASRRGWRSSDHGDSGWYGDPEGHRRAAQRGWDNPDHGPSGWYGDPEGHSEASRRGWEERRSYSRRYDDDDDYDRRRRYSRR
jgi:hypothetical protein